MKIIRTPSKVTIGSLLLCGALASGTVFAADAKIKTDKQKFSYAIGFQIGQSFKSEQLNIDSQALAQAIDDVLAGGPLKMTMDEMRTTMDAFQAQKVAERQASASKSIEAGKAFLSANKSKPGVKVLPSGLQYKIIATGNGKQPLATDSITAHYRGTLLNGKEFDSSYARGEPATFSVNQVIKGWQEILPLMHEGDKWQIFIPSDLAYGAQGAGANIGPNETLIFDIELIKVNTAK